MSRSDDTNCGSFSGSNLQGSPSTPSNHKRKTSFSPKFKKKQEEVISSYESISRAEKNRLMALEKLRGKKLFGSASSTVTGQHDSSFIRSKLNYFVLISF